MRKFVILVMTIVTLAFMLGSLMPMKMDNADAATLSPVDQVLAATYFLNSPDFTCTATAVEVDPQGTTFLTARHCSVANNYDASSREPNVVVSQGLTGPVIPVVLSQRPAKPDQDWALFRTKWGYQAPAVLPISTLAPMIGEQLITAGY